MLEKVFFYISYITDACNFCTETTSVFVTVSVFFFLFIGFITTMFGLFHSMMFENIYQAHFLCWLYTFHPVISWQAVWHVHYILHIMICLCVCEGFFNLLVFSDCWSLVSQFKVTRSTIISHSVVACDRFSIREWKCGQTDIWRALTRSCDPDTVWHETTDTQEVVLTLKLGSLDVEKDDTQLCFGALRAWSCFSKLHPAS